MCKKQEALYSFLTGFHAPLQDLSWLTLGSSVYDATVELEAMGEEVNLTVTKTDCLSADYLDYNPID